MKHKYIFTEAQVRDIIDWVVFSGRISGGEKCKMYKKNKCPLDHKIEIAVESMIDWMKFKGKIKKASEGKGPNRQRS